MGDLDAASWSGQVVALHEQRERSRGAGEAIVAAGFLVALAFGVATAVAAVLPVWLGWYFWPRRARALGAAEVVATPASLRYRSARGEGVIVSESVDVAWVTSSPRAVLTLRSPSGTHHTLEFQRREDALEVLGLWGQRPGHDLVALRVKSDWLLLLEPIGGLVLGLAAIALTLVFFAALVRHPAVSLGVVLPLAAALWGVRRLIGNSHVVEVVVGRDGVLVRDELGEQFHPFAAIASVEAMGAGLGLRLGDGRLVAVLPRHAPPWRFEALDARLTEALGVWRRGAASALRGGDLARSGQPLDAWHAQLRRLSSVPKGYRARAVDPSMLLSLLDDPQAPVIDRVAAALSLTDASRGLAPTHLARVRMVCDSSADDALRVALSSIVSGTFDDHALRRLERALARRAR